MAIGPVQSYISQARRTRDLLAGSFLLSFLSGHAMAQVLEEGGRIYYPRVHGPGDPPSTITDELLGAIWERKKQGAPLTKGPMVGSLPNRFHAVLPPEVNPETIVTAVDEAWKQVAEAVKKKAFPHRMQMPESTQEIWNRQVGHFWEITWVVGEEPALLNQRKYWRSHLPCSEPGDKCTLTGNLQELSGCLRAHDREKQDEFWRDIQDRIPSFDLQENERLSAIALIKRLYPLVAEAALGWELPQKAVNFPSTGYLAAMPWIFSTGKKRPEAMESFARLAQQAGIPCAEDPGFQPEGAASSFHRLEGSVFFASNLERDNYWEENRRNKTHKSDLEKALLGLTDQGKDTPSPFYALLLMDGDQLGNLLHHHKEKVSDALARFTEKLPDVVGEEKGFTVYAGGDDVFALFPLAKGLPAAIRLRQRYEEAFTKVGISEKASISAALVYAHYKAPLQGVLQNAHELLDKVAKQTCERDSLAIRVWKGGGPLWTWSCPWPEVFQEDHLTRLEAVAEQIQDRQVYSSSFFHHLRTRLEPLQPEGECEKEKKAYQEMIHQLLVAEYRRSAPKVSREQAEERMKVLLTLCVEKRWDEQRKIENGRFRTEGALIAHFLATEGREGV